MARPKSEDKRIALLEAAVRVFVAHGLGAPTALISKEAGVANGTLFTYFDTKGELVQQLYRELKLEMASALLRGLLEEKGLRERFFHVWSNWMHWAMSNPDKLRVLALLAVSEDVTPELRVEVGKFMWKVEVLLEQSRANGPLRDAPIAFVGEILTSLANATMGFMASDPENAEQHCKTGFEALWRVIG
ncbi:TetR/AcrR family transcriptional regulator [bacterium]|nr:MAG: TetR/AcrR family transcriptional regulator [bacterium]